MKKIKKPSIKWSAMLKIEDVCPRRSRWGQPYILLYTNAGIAVCADEAIGNRICLYEPYEMRGYLKAFTGGSYLKLEKLEHFDSKKYIDM